MIKAEIVSSSVPAVVSPGTPVNCTMLMRNAGDEAGEFLLQVAWWTGTKWVWYESSRQVLQPGAFGTFVASFLMYTYDSTVYLYACHKDPVTPVIFRDEISDPLTVAVPYTPPADPPRAFIDAYAVPGSARNGDTVIVPIQVRNGGGTAGALRGWLQYKVAGQWVNRDIGFQQIDVGGTYLFSVSFVMPAESTDVLLVADHWNATAQIWYLDTTSGPYTITLNTDDLIDINIPSDIREALSSAWLNFKKGDWADVLGFKLPPFTFEPGLWTLRAFDYILDGVNTVVNKVRETWDKAYDAAITAGNALTKTNDWLSYAVSWWDSRISSWWVGAQEWVISWVEDKTRTLWTVHNGLSSWVNSVYQQLSSFTAATKSWQTWLLKELATIPPIDTLITGYNKVENFFTVHLQNIGDFFKDPPGWIFDKIDNWLNGEVE
jgi:hypothetical protein